MASALRSTAKSWRTSTWAPSCSAPPPTPTTTPSDATTTAGAMRDQPSPIGPGVSRPYSLTSWTGLVAAVGAVTNRGVRWSARVAPASCSTWASKGAPQRRPMGRYRSATSASPPTTRTPPPSSDGAAGLLAVGAGTVGAGSPVGPVGPVGSDGVPVDAAVPVPGWSPRPVPTHAGPLVTPRTTTAAADTPTALIPVWRAARRRRMARTIWPARSAIAAPGSAGPVCASARRSCARLRVMRDSLRGRSRSTCRTGCRPAGRAVPRGHGCRR